MENCGRCHTCGGKLKTVLDGEEWCPRCNRYRRYPSHGWTKGSADPNSPCLDPAMDTHVSITKYMHLDNANKTVHYHYSDPFLPETWGGGTMLCGAKMGDTWSNLYWPLAYFLQPDQVGFNKYGAIYYKSCPDCVRAVQEKINKGEIS